IGINKNDLDFLYNSTIELIQSNNISINSKAIESIINTPLNQTITLFLDNNIPFKYTIIGDNLFEGYQISKKQENDLINSIEASNTSMEDLIVKYGTKVRYSEQGLIDYYLDLIGSNTSEDITDFNADEYNRLKFVDQRDEFFRAY